MREQCYVKNLENCDYSEVFNGDPIIIRANSKIKMGYKEAKRFLGSFNATINKHTGQPLVKNLEIERIKEEIEEDDLNEVEFICNLCNSKFNSSKKLDEHLKDHADLITKDEGAEERNEDKKKRKEK